MGIVGGILGLALFGCEGPNGIVPVTPPGAVIPRESPDAEPAQARGEMAAQSGVGESTPAAPAVESVVAAPTAKGQTKTTKGGVKYETLQEGTGPELKSGQTATLHYVGKLEEGNVFDTTRKDNAPKKFRIGVQPLIKGWEEAIPGMKVGEIRKLIVPPSQAYGAEGKSPRIPPNATLIFEIELVDIAP
jgi:FKBP-type peptidyl-prolyl cis-trans isomerase